MTALAKQHGLKVSTNTNGSALNAANAKKIVEAGIDVINISIDSTDPEQFAAIRRQTTLEQALTAAENLNSAKKNLGRATPLLGVAVVAMRDNVRELPKLVRLARRLGARWVLAKGVLPWKEEIEPQSLHNDPELAVQVGREAQRPQRNPTSS
jgi:MoaA/NifB/PqqE/SkfB family radical SAM enzyme